MLQCHFLDLVLSKHFVVYESVRTTHLVFHFQLRAICRTRLQCTAEHHQSLLVCRRCRCCRYARHADTYLNTTHLDGKQSDGVP